MATEKGSAKIRFFLANNFILFVVTLKNASQQAPNIFLSKLQISGRPSES